MIASEITGEIEKAQLVEVVRELTRCTTQDRAYELLEIIKSHPHSDAEANHEVLVLMASNLCEMFIDAERGRKSLAAAKAEKNDGLTLLIMQFRQSWLSVNQNEPNNLDVILYLRTLVDIVPLIQEVTDDTVFWITKRGIEKKAGLDAIRKRLERIREKEAKKINL